MSKTVTTDVCFSAIECTCGVRIDGTTPDAVVACAVDAGWIMDDSAPQCPVCAGRADPQWRLPYRMGCCMCGRDCGAIIEQHAAVGRWLMVCVNCEHRFGSEDHQQICNVVYYADELDEEVRV